MVVLRCYCSSHNRVGAFASQRIFGELSFLCIIHTLHTNKRTGRPMDGRKTAAIILFRQSQRYHFVSLSDFFLIQHAYIQREGERTYP